MWSHRRQPTRLPRPWDSPAKNTGVGCHSLLQCMKVKSEREVIQLCPILRDPMDCSPPGSSIHGIFQARVLEWGAIALLRGGKELLSTYCMTCPENTGSSPSQKKYPSLENWITSGLGDDTCHVLYLYYKQTTSPLLLKELELSGYLLSCLCETLLLPFWLIKEPGYKHFLSSGPCAPIIIKWPVSCNNSF